MNILFFLSPKQDLMYVYDDFTLRQTLPCLGTNALQTAGNTILHVVHRHDNADEWVVHDGRSPLYGYYTFILKITECILTNEDTSPLGQSYL